MNSIDIVYCMHTQYFVYFNHPYQLNSWDTNELFKSKRCKFKQVNHIHVDRTRK